MCAVQGCSNVPTRKVTVGANTIVGYRQETIEVCEEHWSAISGCGSRYSMGYAPTENYGNGEYILQQTNGDAKPKS